MADIRLDHSSGSSGPRAARVWSVTEANQYIKNMFQTDPLLKNIRVRGELSNVKKDQKGHVYFSLKEEGNILAGIMFAREASTLRIKLSDGMKVIVTGRIETYPATGRYQIYASAMEQEGMGELFQEFLRRKQEYEEMGMFAPEYKKPIPRFATNIGVITSAKGAAVHDIITTAKRRNPYIRLTLCPTIVQGESAAANIAGAIQYMDSLGFDLLIVGRGGGSIEELWAFNEEPVVRAIFEADTPIISAVGHDVDYTIADYVADLRAITPTAAGELAVTPTYSELMAYLESRRDLLNNRFFGRTGELRYHLYDLRSQLEKQSPKARTEKYKGRLALCRLSLNREIAECIQMNHKRCSELRNSQNSCIRCRLEDVRRSFIRSAGKLDAVSPLKRLNAGYGYVTTSSEKPVRNIDDVSVADTINIFVRNGRIEAKVEGKESLTYEKKSDG